MSDYKSPLVGHFDASHSSVGSYVIGFVSSLILTLTAYLAAVSHDLSDRAAVLIIGVLAIVQCVVQLRRFLHLGTEFKPRWKLGVFALMLVLVVIIVGGTIWIMDNLNYRMLHSSEQTLEYVKGQDGL